MTFYSSCPPPTPALHPLPSPFHHSSILTSPFYLILYQARLVQADAEATAGMAQREASQRGWFSRGAGMTRALLLVLLLLLVVLVVVVVLLVLLLLLLFQLC